MRYNKWLPIIAGCGVILGGSAGRATVSQDNFLLKNTGDLVDLCSAPQSDPSYLAAIHFCEGFAVGVFRVLQAVDASASSRHLFCLPSPPPTRTDVISGFVQWAKADPNRMAQQPEDQFAAFLSQKYPCSRGR